MPPPNQNDNAPRTYTEEEIKSLRDAAYNKGKNDAVENIESEFRPVTAALGLPPSATCADVLKAIAALKANPGRKADPKRESAIQRRIDAGLSREQAEEVHARQEQHDAEEAAAAAARAKAAKK